MKSVNISTGLFFSYFSQVLNFSRPRDSMFLISMCLKKCISSSCSEISVNNNCEYFCNTQVILKVTIASLTICLQLDEGSRKWNLFWKAIIINMLSGMGSLVMIMIDPPRNVWIMTLWIWEILHHCFFGNPVYILLPVKFLNKNLEKRHILIDHGYYNKYPWNSEQGFSKMCMVYIYLTFIARFVVPTTWIILVC